MRLIDAEKLAKNFEGRKKIWFSRDEVLDEIADAESVETNSAHMKFTASGVEFWGDPLRHGRWVMSDDKGFLVCSVCRDCFIGTGWVKVTKCAYCPNCGARMDGDA